MNNKDIMDELEEEEWKRLEEQIASLFDEEEEENNGTTKSTNSTADRANDTEERKSDTRSNGVAKYVECECGYRGHSVPLASHSDWCGYKKWRLHEDKRKEYNDIRIWF